MPQYTTSARDAATFNEGAMIYNTTTQKINFYNGTSWTELPGMTLGLPVAPVSYTHLTLPTICSV